MSDSQFPDPENSLLQENLRLKQKIAELSSHLNSQIPSNSFITSLNPSSVTQNSRVPPESPDSDPFELKISINVIACEDHESEPNGENLQDLNDKNSKLKKQIIKEKKLSKRLQEELELARTTLIEIEAKHSYDNGISSTQLQELRDELIDKINLIDRLEQDNRHLKSKTEKAEAETRKTAVELQKSEEKRDENRDENLNGQNEEITQMHEDMRRLLEFKNELEALIEEQNKEIDHKNRRINDLVDKNKFKDAEILKFTSYTENLERQNKELKAKISQYSSKFNKLRQGKTSENQKTINDMNREIELLKEMVKSSKNELRSKDISIKKFQK